MSNDKKKKRGEEGLAFDDENFDADHLFEDWPEDPEAESRFRKTVEGFVPDIFKRSLTAGIGSLFMSDDGLRSLVADKKLPKEAVGYLIGQADATKREFMRIVSREIREFLENMDFGGELTKILTSISFEIRTEVRFIPNDAALKPNVRNRIKVKQTRKDEDGNEVEESEEFVSETGDEASPKKRRWSRRGTPKKDGEPE
ncbi:MAG: hypothetical protein H0U74_05855 [Bradymonadaceae bacterium]|nr:hypothetical protein [Lujinxingiaceae bacterium]